MNSERCSAIYKWVKICINLYFCTRDVPLHESSLQIALEVVIPKAWCSIAKARCLDRVPRRRSHALPGNERLLTALLHRVDELVVNGPDADISNQRSCSAKVAGYFLVLAVGGDGYTTHCSRFRLRREPDNNILPIMPVSETGTRAILWHVPCVHDPVGAVVGSCASIHLTEIAATAAIGRT